MLQVHLTLDAVAILRRGAIRRGVYRQNRGHIAADKGRKLHVGAYTRWFASRLHAISLPEIV